MEGDWEEPEWDSASHQDMLFNTRTAIQREWEMSPAKNPPISAVIRDHRHRDRHLLRVHELQSEANAQLREGDFDAAINKSLECESLIVRAFGPNHAELVYVHLLLGEAYLHQNELDQARERLLEAQRLLSLFPGLTDAHVYRVTCYQDLAELYKLTGHIEESVALFQKVAAIRETLQGPRHPDTALAFVNLAVALKVQGHFDRALALLGNARAVMEEVYGLESVQAASVWNHTGSVFLRMSRWNDAQAAYERGRAILERNGLLNNPDLATVNCNLGTVYSQLERHDDALICFEKARALRERLFGPSHPDTAACELHIGRLLLSVGRVEEAERRALRAWDAHSHSPASVTSAAGAGAVQTLLGDIALAKQRNVEALQHYRVARDAYARAPGHQEDVDDVDANIANVFLAQGESDHALALFASLLEKAEKRRGERHPTTASLLNSIGNVYRQQGRNSEAFIAYTRALEIFQMVYGMHDPCTATLHMNLGNLYYSTKDYGQAMRHYVQARAIRERLFGAVHDASVAVYRALGMVFLSQGKHDEALEYFQRSVDAMEALHGPDAEEVQTLRRTVANLVRARAHARGMGISTPHRRRIGPPAPLTPGVASTPGH